MKESEKHVIYLIMEKYQSRRLMVSEPPIRKWAAPVKNDGATSNKRREILSCPLTIFNATVFFFMSCQLLIIPCSSAFDPMFDLLSLFVFLSDLPNFPFNFLLLGQFLMGIRTGFLCFEMGLTCAACCSFVLYGADVDYLSHNF